MEQTNTVNLSWQQKVIFLASMVVVVALNPLAVMAAESSGGISALGINLPGLIAQLVNFGVLLLILRLLAWGPIMRIVDERREKIEAGLNAAVEASEAAERSQEAAKAALEEARTEGRELVARAQETAARLSEELETQARSEAEQIVSRARAEIDAERQQAINSLRSEFAELTVNAAERVIGQSLDRDAHQRLITESLVGTSFSDSEEK